MRIEFLQAADWQRVKQLRIAALKDTPDAFASTLEHALNLDDTQWINAFEELATFIIVSDKKDLGMVRCAPDKSDSSCAFLISMWVAPEIRRTGAATKLVQAVIQWAKANGYSRLLLDVANDNFAAIALYSKLKFGPTGETGALPYPRQHILEHRLARDL